MIQALLASCLFLSLVCFALSIADHLADVLKDMLISLSLILLLFSLSHNFDYRSQAYLCSSDYSVLLALSLNLLCFNRTSLYCEVSS